MMKYFRIWRVLSGLAISSYLSNGVDSISYFVGKLVRFIFFLVLIFSIFRFMNDLVGYSKYEVIIFFLTFNLMDVLAQAFFRGIYLFKDDVKRGNFDYIISKPVNSLFYSMSRLTDILDIFFLIPLVFCIIFIMFKLKFIITFWSVFLYIIFIFFGMIIVLGFHIISACITIWAVESENFIWLYRESMTVGRFPPEIFSFSIQAVFTFVVPIIIIVAFPVKALLGLIDWPWLVFSSLYAVIFLYFSIVLWNISLKHYSSASS